MFSLSNPIVKNLLSTLVKDAKKKDLKGYVLFFDEKGEPKTAELKKDENVYSTKEIEKMYSSYSTLSESHKAQKMILEDSGKKIQMLVAKCQVLEEENEKLKSQK